MTLLTNIENHAHKNADRIAIKIDKQQITYKALKDEIATKHYKLQQIEQQATVALNIQNPLTLIIYYLAVLQSNAIPCVIDYRWPQETKNKIYKQYGINYEINNAETITQLHHHIMDQNLEDILHIGFTSGTTGLPKAYFRNEQSWLESYDQHDLMMKEVPPFIISPGPIAHSLALFTCIYALYIGNTFVGQQQFDATTLLKDMCVMKNDIAFFGVPTMIQQLALQNIKVPQLSHLFSTGDKFDHNLRARIAQQFENAIIIEFFGSSEASYISYNYNNEAPNHSVGKLFPNVATAITNKDERGIGLLSIKSNMTFSGYVPQKINSNEWIAIGDYASIDKDNYLYLHGREHDRLIIGGENVYPIEIERAMALNEAVDEVLVIGQKHHKFGELAILLYTGDRQIDYKEMRAFLATKLYRYQIPSKIVKVPKMVYTSSGKIARKEMQRQYEEGTFNI
ncbi:AMP-binding protein [Staphylococcus kloosii]|jgi:long-chain acyl-CoA synthetase|uniref:Putative long chain fatty acid-CoA ligase VraA n=1 Tax=Staphylococcus kloosii TaxID=29384 RepID=A0ABQ0XPJ0_9STAP|nr:AMP-binding protein [Staphylococcus kloosii]AVQ36966.1 acyl-CoA synthetase [Staphylococcus kloosii]PNZ07077.1 acyl-CoA synthetase [Staphylococcus kloosii]GEP83336.1 long-chain-fatty-acid--CoA ligase [Staphylococcus kloosii]SUM50069.1 acyl-CoA synthetase [Staphylococcus kloosii]